MPRKSRPELIDSKHRRARRRALLIGRYLDDQEFEHALVELAEIQDGVEAFCDDWGLTFDDCDVEAAIEIWCERHRSNDDSPPCELSDSWSSASFVPDYRRLIPFRVFWSPAEESRANAEARLRSAFEKRLQIALDDISGAYECSFGKTPRQQRSPKLATHMSWLFERQRHGRTYDAIAKDNPTGDSDTVRKACGRLAESMGLKLRRG